MDTDNLTKQMKAFEKLDETAQKARQRLFSSNVITAWDEKTMNLQLS